jgi:hypothetical protein
VSRPFEAALKARCDGDSDVAPLAAQWEFDKRLYANALATTAQVFQHYSRHDSSHSHTILVQLSRVMGEERIELLSATDLWLILEAAYSHDIGMVVPDDEARRHWVSPDFRRFLDEKLRGSDPDLRRAAELVSDDAEHEPFSAWPLDIRHAALQLLAEFIRPRHADRAQAIIRDPSHSIGLHSPRSGLLPQRLFNQLADISRAHGQDFKQIMELPRVISGMGTDEAHPRFVACMLRVGDLLDLDNGRFCPVLQRVVGHTPAVSAAHIEKHSAIKRFHVSRESIEVEAECSTYEGYEVTWKWLEWLQQEITQQMVRWSEISPPGFGPLPSLGRIEAHQKNYLTLAPGQRPKFGIDRDAVLRLLQGANVYKEPEECIREVIQNAIDASILRCWHEKWSHLDEEELKRQTPETLRQALLEYPIDVELTRQPGDAQGKIIWRVSIRDRGTGIATSDLRYMLTVGSSHKNPGRRDAILRMPEWMRPTGIFGIGLQSVFLLTNQIRLRSRHFDSHEALEIVLRQNELAGDDSIQLKRLEGDLRASTPVGTEVSFAVVVDRFPPRWSSREEGSEAGRLIREFDPIVDKELPYLVACCRDQVRRLARYSLATIRLDGTEIRSSTAQNPFRFDGETGCELAVTFSAGLPRFYGPLAHVIASEDVGGYTVFYRGAPLEVQKYPSLTQKTWNVHFGQADRLLTLNREGWTSAGYREFYERSEKTWRRILPNIISELRASNSKDLPIASLVAFLGGISECGDEWRTVTLGEDESAIALGDLVNLSAIELRMSYTAETGFLRREDRNIVITSESSWLQDLLLSEYKYVKYDGPFEDGSSVLVNALLSNGRWGDRFFLSKTSGEDCMSDNALKHIILRLGRSMRRSSIPCQRDFAALQCNDSDLYALNRIIGWITPRMISPFVVLSDESLALPHLTQLIHWTQHNSQKGSSISEIGSAYLAFIVKVDSLLDGKEVRKAYSMDRVMAELGRM